MFYTVHIKPEQLLNKCKLQQTIRYQPLSLHTVDIILKKDTKLLIILGLYNYFVDTYS